MNSEQRTRHSKKRQNSKWKNGALGSRECEPLSSYEGRAATAAHSPPSPSSFSPLLAYPLLLFPRRLSRTLIPPGRLNPRFSIIMDSNVTQAMLQRSKSRTARFKDTLFVSTTVANNREANNQDQSAWSPLTPPSSTPPATEKSLFTRFSQAKTRSAPSEQNDSRSPSSASPPPDPRPSAESLLKNVFGRMLRQPGSPTLPTISRPIQIHGYGEPNYDDLPSFGPLTSEKPRRDSVRYDMIVARKKKRRNIYIAAALLGITIVVVVIILVVRLVKPNKDAGVTAKPTGSSSPVPSPSPTPTPSTSPLLTPDQSKCLTDFIASAPSAPLDYPVSCLKTLQSVPAEITTTDPTAAGFIVAAKQFSALRLLFDGCSGAAQQGLNAGRWFKDTKLCAWSGVQCDGSGRVSQL